MAEEPKTEALPQRTPLPSREGDLLRVALGDWTETEAAAGDFIDRYRLVEELGEGGFGVVWKAEQSEPLQRLVALKIVKVGMDTTRVVERFNAERQTLALMDHPGIAAVFDAGATESGRPYFVMEWVRGAPIHRYCNERNLTIEQRVNLFIEVCYAVHHAHQKGVLHRDLKPSNILVTEVDGQPTPKIIDFGISKVLFSDTPSERLLQTQQDWIVGTPTYMSPEQAVLGSDDLDTRADIYSLGVLLCLLVAGDTPILNASSSKAPIDELLRRIREEEPLRPSQIAQTTSAEEVASRGASRPQLVARLKGDVDWIILKALEKDREQRYDSAAALATELTRHLNDEPISAGRPSVRTQMVKFARRHRAFVASTAVALVALMIGTIIATQAYIRENRMRTLADEQRARAEQQEIEAQRQTQLAIASENDARAQQAVAEQTLFFLNTLLAETAHQVQSGRNPEALRLALDALCSDLDRFGHDPELRESILAHSGRLYRSLGEDHKAVPLLEQQLALTEAKQGPTSEATLEALSLYARGLSLAGQDDLAITTNEELVRRWQSLPPSRVQELRTFGAKRDLGSLHFRAGHYQKALEIYEELAQSASASVRSHGGWMTFRRYHAEVFTILHRHAEAVEVIQETISSLDLENPDHVHAAAVLRLQESRATFMLRDIPGAIRLLQTSIEMDSATKSDQYAALSERWVEISRLHTLLHQHDEAIAACQQALDISTSIGDRVQQLAARHALAENLEAAARFAEAAAVYQSCAEAARDSTNRPNRSPEFHLAQAARNLARSGQNWPVTASLAQRLEVYVAQAETDASVVIDREVKTALRYAQARLAEANGERLPMGWVQDCLKMALAPLRQFQKKELPPNAQPWKVEEVRISSDYQERSKTQNFVNFPTPADLLALDDAASDRWSTVDPASALLSIGASLRIAGHYALALRAYQAIHTIPKDRLLVPERRVQARILAAECLLQTNRDDRIELAHRQLAPLLKNRKSIQVGASFQSRLTTLQQLLQTSPIADAP